MHSLTKLSLLGYYLTTLGNCVSGQTTVSSLYLPSISDSGGLDVGSFLIGSLVGAQSGTSTYVLLLGSTDTDTDAGPTPTFTLVEASTTAHLFGDQVLDDEGDSATIDIQCTINGGLSNCEGVAGVLAAGTTVSATTSAFTETVSPIPVTLVNTLPSVTPSPSQHTNTPASSSPSSGSSSNPAASTPQVTSGNTPSTPSGSSSNGTTPAPVAPGPASSSKTTPPPNSAMFHTVSILLCVFPLAVVSMLL